MAAQASTSSGFISKHTSEAQVGPKDVHAGVDMENVDTCIAHMEELAEKAGFKTAFKAVPSNYYNEDYAWRAEVLGTGKTEELCKAVIMGNTKLTDDKKAPGRCEYVLVIVQYEAKLHKERLGLNAARKIEELNGLEGMGRKAYNFRVVEESVFDALSGYPHNATCPLAMAARLPVIMSDKIAGLEGFWLGGGHVDVKMRQTPEEFIKVFNPMVAEITG